MDDFTSYACALSSFPALCSLSCGSALAPDSLLAPAPILDASGARVIAFHVQCTLSLHLRHIPCSSILK